MRYATALLFLACSPLFGCSTPTAGPEDDAPTKKTKAAHEHTFGPIEVAAGAEVDELCVSWTLDNAETLYVSAVEMVATTGFHHSNWFWVPEDRYLGDDGGDGDGVWNCQDRVFNEAVAAATGGVLFAQSTQAEHEVQRFGEGVVIPIPPRSRVVAGLHLLNTTPKDLDAELALELHDVPEDAVHTRLSGLSLQYKALEIPPMSQSAFSGSCAVGDKHDEALGRPLDLSLYYVLPHYHDLGTGLRLEALKDGEPTTIFSEDGAVGDPLGVTLSEPFDMTGYDELRFTCHYDNPRTESVGWGIGDQEMCVLLAFTDSENLWGGGVFDPSEEGPEMVGDVPHFGGPCTLITYPSKAHTDP